MVVRRKSGRTTSAEADMHIGALIRKKNPVSEDNQSLAASLRLVQLRLAPMLLDRIDASRQRRQVPPSRHMWMLEALHEKLAREEAQH